MTRDIAGLRRLPKEAPVPILAPSPEEEVVFMRSLVSAPWRLCFILAALFIMIGGPLHPKGDRTMTTMAAMAEMLANPSWVPAHALMLAGFVALLVGLILYQRHGSLP